MNYFLDANIIIYFLNNKYPTIKLRLEDLAPKQVTVPAIVKAELLYGAYKSNHRQRNEKVVRKFLEVFQIAPFHSSAAESYATLRSDLENKGNLIGPNDMIIAATALAANATLVTNNVKEFRKVSGLKIENWVET